jgi:hypothetical protein
MLEWLRIAHAPDPPPPIPPPVPRQLDQIQLDTGGIVFRNGVPVGGNSHLSLFPNGAYSFTGHYHDSGATSYDMGLVWVIKSSSGTAYTFAHAGKVHGTFDPGSRNDDWGDTGTNPALSAGWADISAGYSFQRNAAANFNLTSLVDTALKAVGAAAAVIAIV